MYVCRMSWGLSQKVTQSRLKFLTEISWISLAKTLKNYFEISNLQKLIKETDFIRFKIQMSVWFTANCQLKKLTFCYKKFPNENFRGWIKFRA